MTCRAWPPSLLSLTLLPAHATEDPPRPVGIQQWRYPVDGQQMPAMDAMLEQMQNLPADQRRMMEEMLAAQGVSSAARVCDLPEQGPGRGGRVALQGRSGVHSGNHRAWRQALEVPFRMPRRPRGETRFISDKEFVSTVDSEYRQGTETGSSRIESHARWIADDCGALKPAR